MSIRFSFAYLTHPAHHCDAWPTSEHRFWATALFPAGIDTSSSRNNLSKKPSTKKKGSKPPMLEDFADCLEQVI